MGADTPRSPAPSPAGISPRAAPTPRQGVPWSTYFLWLQSLWHGGGLPSSGAPGSQASDGMVLPRGPDFSPSLLPGKLRADALGGQQARPGGRSTRTEPSGAPPGLTHWPSPRPGSPATSGQDVGCRCASSCALADPHQANKARGGPDRRLPGGGVPRARAAPTLRRCGGGRAGPR